MGRKAAGQFLEPRTMSNSVLSFLYNCMSSQPVSTVSTTIGTLLFVGSTIFITSCWSVDYFILNKTLYPAWFF